MKRVSTASARAPEEASEVDRPAPAEHPRDEQLRLIGVPQPRANPLTSRPPPVVGDAEEAAGLRSRARHHHSTLRSAKHAGRSVLSIERATTPLRDQEALSSCCQGVEPALVVAEEPKSDASIRRLERRSRRQGARAF